MKKMIKLFSSLFFVAIINCHPVFASSIQLFSPPTNFELLAPIAPALGDPIAYSKTGLDHLWKIASWGIPKALPPFTQKSYQSNLVFFSKSAAAEVDLVRQPGGASNFTLVQNGNGLPCSGNAGSEFDLFASPQSLAEEPSLGVLSSLTVDARVKIWQVAGARACDISQEGTLVSLVLSNSLSRQTLFYQVALSELCGRQPKVRLQLCVQSTKHPQIYFFARRNPYGVDDNLPAFGQTWILDGQSRHLELDLLPHLLKAVLTGPKDLDKTISDWHVTGYYIGSHVWGNMSLSSSWSDLKLTSTVRNR